MGLQAIIPSIDYSAFKPFLSTPSAFKSINARPLTSSSISSIRSSALHYEHLPLQKITRETPPRIYVPIILIPLRSFATQTDIALTTNPLPDPISMAWHIPNPSDTSRASWIMQKVNYKAIQKAQQLQPSIQKKYQKFICITCNKQYTSKLGLSFHKYLHVPKEQWPLECGNCQKRFYRSDYLKTHVLRTHGGQDTFEKPFNKNHKFTCNICNQGFARWRNLNFHNYIHLPKTQWPHECRVCQERFYRPDTLKMHENRKHAMHGGY